MTLTPLVCTIVEVDEHAIGDVYRSHVHRANVVVPEPICTTVPDAGDALAEVVVGAGVEVECRRCWRA